MPIDLGLATVIGGVLGFGGQTKANKENTKLAREQMRFQERMSNTAYQRAMSDMRKAGLNPLLAYQKGGASTPSGAAPNIRNPMEGAATTAANYVAAQTAKANVKNIEANTALTLEKARTEKFTQGQIRANTGLLGAQQTLAGANTALSQMNFEKGWIEMKRIRADIARIYEVTDLTAGQARNLSVTFENLLTQGDILASELTAKQRDAIYAAIQAKIYESGVGEAKVWIETLGLGKPSEWIDFANKWFKKSGGRRR